MTEQEERLRWHYRFDNFSRAFVLLREAVDTMEERALNQLEKEGMIQRFEYSWELAWKTMADFIASEGLNLPTVTPRAVLKASFQAGIISDGDEWMAALDARNKMSHVYNFKIFEQVIEALRTRFLPLFERFHEDFQMRRING